MRERMSLAVVQSITLLLRETRYKDEITRQYPELSDGAVMGLLAPWQG